MSTILVATWQCSPWGLQRSHAVSQLRLFGLLTNPQCARPYFNKSVSFQPKWLFSRQHDHAVQKRGFLAAPILHTKQPDFVRNEHSIDSTKARPAQSPTLPSSLKAAYRGILAAAIAPHSSGHDPALQQCSPQSSSQMLDVGAQPEDNELPTQAQLNDIFGMEVDRTGAASLLSRLQRQRRDGTLDQPLPYPPVLLERGLAYLRSKYPVDEDAAIIARLDREIDGDWSLPQNNPGQSKTGDSGLMEIRRINKAKREAEEVEREHEEEEARRKQEERRRRGRDEVKGGAVQIGGQEQGLSAADGSLGGTDSAGKVLILSERMENFITANDARIRASNAWVARYRRKATPRYIPQMTTWQRLWPCGCFSLCVVGLALIFAQVYTPPEQNARLFPDVPPAAAAVGTLVAINVAIFIAWRIPPLWPRLNRQFMVVPAIPQAFSMLGAEFSHSQFSHLAINMIGMALVGTHLHDDIGRGPFIALIASSAVISSFVSMSAYVIPKIFITATLGASGIVCAFLGTACVLHEGQRVRFPLIPPEITSSVNTAVLLALLIAVEIRELAKHGRAPVALVNSPEKHVDRIGHLAGYATGIGAGLIIRQTNDHWGNVPRSSFWRPKAKVAAKGKPENVALTPEVMSIDVSRRS